MRQPQEAELKCLILGLLVAALTVSAAEARPRHRNHSVAYSGTIVEHPPGCPSRAFCGCGVALRVFGRHVRSLWLAANWFKFPPAHPAPGMVAVRKHHVFLIQAVHGDGTVTAYDPNSGGRKTRVHVRSLAGFSVRNPHGYGSSS